MPVNKELFPEEIYRIRQDKTKPYAYLRYIFEKLPTSSSLEDYEALRPWNVTLEQMNCPTQLSVVR